jgi:hypothetical protein
MTAATRTETEPKSGRRVWVIVGIVAAVVIALFVALAVGMFYLVSGMLKESEAYRAAVQAMQANAQVVELLGPPITSGFPSGNVRTSGPNGEAELAIPVAGQRATGTLYIQATKSMGVWKTEQLVLELDGRGERIDLIRPGTAI